MYIKRSDPIIISRAIVANLKVKSRATSKGVVLIRRSLKTVPPGHVGTLVKEPIPFQAKDRAIPLTKLTSERNQPLFFLKKRHPSTYQLIGSPEPEHGRYVRFTGRYKTGYVPHAPFLVRSRVVEGLSFPTSTWPTYRPLP